MKIPLSWLREYVDIDLSSQELAHRLTMAGIEVGEVTVVGGWTNCVVGHVEKVEPVPDADRLTLCTVNSGDGDVQVVCGAPNVAAGQRIAYAGIGARLFNPHSGKTETLKAARIRGVTSQGMICSELELGLSNEHTGILVLPEDAPVGMDLTEYMGDEILELELTPNRFDCMSLLGVAHEVAALTGRRVREPDLAYPEDGGPVESAGIGGSGRPGSLPQVHRHPDPGNHHRAFSPVAPGAPDQGWHAPHQQRRRYHKLRDAGVQPAPPCLRLRQGCRRQDHRPPGKTRRAAGLPGWHRAQVVHRTCW